MKKKKTTFKFIMLIVFLLVFILIVAGTCKRKVNAIYYPIYDETFTISDRDMGSVGFACAYFLAPNPSSTYLLTQLSSENHLGESIYLTYGYSGEGFLGYLYINYTDGTNSYNVDTIHVNNPIIIVSVSIYRNELYLMIDDVEPAYIETTPPEIDYFEYSQIGILNLEDYGFSSDYYDYDLTINLGSSSNPSKSLLQLYYLEVGDTLNNVYRAFESCINDKYLNTYITYGYDYGYNYGYDIGESAGENTGYIAGYNVGYTDGQNAENAMPLIFAVLQGVFETIGAFLSIEILPHLTIGLFFALPLFFSVVGLILWIWRRN